MLPWIYHYIEYTSRSQTIILFLLLTNHQQNVDSISLNEFVWYIINYFRNECDLFEFTQPTTVGLKAGMP